MNFDPSRRTFDCTPTLNDKDILRFCRDGYLHFEGVVPDEINERTCEYLNGKIPVNPCYIPEGMSKEELVRIRNTSEPSSILLEDWFIENVLLNPVLSGALRSLLGRHVGLPVLASSHQVQCPEEHQDWHHDLDHIFGPEVNFVEVFYFPQDTPAEMGPTEVIPGSHIRETKKEKNEKGVLCSGPAGTIGLHSQSILHRRGESTATGLRHMLKYNYWRTIPPTRDWIIEQDFDFRSGDYGGHQSARYVAHMFYWLCGKGDKFRIIGGQAWPWRSVNQIGPSYGFDQTQGYLPDWRGNNDDYAR
tara:strand:+ start:49 stop:957 length:909 start_codon:yes stop_codon:yes gene_type:complete